ncbi:unnamed protein product [Mytilus coruscus]|uniref:Uncharacterized protein n=1 Tax=Mytilus coruscus TaxID=42192 RepID=A0A6J8CDR7_MYTCO|nr:unnamed protein product [Mytilus coruscus]
MKLEGKIKELENSNRILRIKVAGNVDSTPTKVVNNDIPNPDLLQHHTEHIVGGFPMHLETQHLQSKIQSMENIYSLNRRVSDLEYNSPKQRLDALELSKQHWPSPQGNNLYHGYQNHISGLQVNGYQNQIPDPNGNGYQNHIPGPHGNGYQNHTPSSNVNSYYNKTPNPQVNGYQNLKPDMHMRNKQPTPNVPFNDSHPPGHLPLKVNMPYMHNPNSHTYPWNLPPPCYMKMQPKSGTQSDIETRSDQKQPTMKCNASSMKNLVTGLPLHLNSTLPNKPLTDPQPSNDAGCSNTVTQELDYATVETKEIVIHHEQIASTDPETESSNEFKSISNQPLISTPTVIAAANIEPHKWVYELINSYSTAR